MQGLDGKAWIDIDHLIDWGDVDALNHELSMALVNLQSTYTGGFHVTTGRHMLDDSGAFLDYGQVFLNFSDQERERYIALDPNIPATTDNRGLLEFVPPTDKQKHYLKIVHGVYFPWQYSLVLFERENPDALTKKTCLSREYTNVLPLTDQFLKRLPYSQIDRVDLLGLDPFHHVPPHRDTAPGVTEIQEFALFSPRKDRRLFVVDETSGQRHYVESRAFTFCNNDFHGVDCSPHFTYVLRVAGRFSKVLRNELKL